MTMSVREQVAANLVDTCVCLGLNESYGASYCKATSKAGKTYWSVCFAKARTLDGAIEVYSPAFIVIKLQGYKKGREVFRSEYDAKAYLIRTFS